MITVADDGNSLIFFYIAAFSSSVLDNIVDFYLFAISKHWEMNISSNSDVLYSIDE
jgi:hypothetical protein